MKIDVKPRDLKPGDLIDQLSPEPGSLDVVPVPIVEVTKNRRYPTYKVVLPKPHRSFYASASRSLTVEREG